MEIRQEAQDYEARLADVVSVVRDTVRRRWLMLLGLTAAVFLATVVLVSLMTPQYVATAKVRLDPGRNPLAKDAQSTRAELAPEAIDTEVTAIKSSDLAREIVKARGLASEPEFAKVLSKSSGATLGNSDTRDAIVANAVLNQLTVSREKLTYVLNVSFRSTNPVDAANLANAFAEGYIEARTTGRVAVAREQNKWFQQQLDQLLREASTADARVAEYRARAGIVESSTQNSAGGTIADQQVAPLSGTLAGAQSDAAAARANLAAARGQVARGNLDAVSAVLVSPVITDLRRQRTAALQARTEIAARYGEDHPESLRVRDQLTQIDGQMAAEARRIVSSLQATSDSAQARVDSLHGSLSQLEAERTRNVRDATTAQGLESEAAAKHALYDKMSQLSLDSVQAAGATIAQAEVIDKARPAARPSSPNKPLLYALGLLIGVGLGGATIGAQEVLSGGFRSVEDLEARLGLPVLAVVPAVPKAKVPADLMLEHPTSMFAEAFRIARTAILGTRGQAEVKVIAITSSLPNEGKTTSAVAFARTLAIANARTLLLECDVRRAAVRQIVKSGTPKIGLVELLHGEADLDHVIQSGDVPNLDQILVTGPYFSAENLFGEGRMEKLLEVLRDRYDHIVLDLPPLMGLADGRYLASLADATVLVVKWNSTPVAAASSAVSWLRNDGGNVIGTLCAQVDASAHAVGGLYYYSKRYADYYQEKAG